MVSPDSVQMSQEFFADPGSYSGFDLTRDGRDMVGCIEPRDPAGIEHGDFPVVLQTGGGAVGEGLDGALALTAAGGRVVAVETAMEADRRERAHIEFGAHVDCAMVGAIRAVTAEMADPSEFTLESTRAWAGFFGEDEHVQATLGRVMDAAGMELELLERRGEMDHLIDRAERTQRVRGEKGARVYTVNLHPYMGQDRNAKPAEPEAAVKVKGYHESLAATVDKLRGDSRLTGMMRGLRMTSALLRAAAVRTVITDGIMPEMTFFEARPHDGPGGLKVVRQEF
jgi:hypothetical protein